MGKYNIFPLENRIDELYEIIYPPAPPDKAFPSGTLHPSKRACKLLLEPTLGSMVPGGNQTRQLQHNREYFKVDFQDFLDYATCDFAPTDIRLPCFSDGSAVFYDALSTTSKPLPIHAVWT